MSQTTNSLKKFYNNYSGYFKEKFGERVQKIPVNAGFTCPNRDGTKGVGGCTFCNNDSFSIHSSSQNPLSLKSQISNSIYNYKKKFPELKKFIIYFQSYTNTYKPLKELQFLYEEALAYEGVIGLSLGTRPDCLEEDKVEYLTKLAQKYHITLEIGLESFNENTLLKINRGHTVKDFFDAIDRCKNRGILLCTHLILGFPWEKQADFDNTLNNISKLDLDFIKFHQLQVVKETAMAVEYLNKPFSTIDQHSYFTQLAQIISHLHPRTVVQRLFSDYSDSFLLSPGWGKSLSILTQEFNSYLDKNGLFQGKFYKQR